MPEKPSRNDHHDFMERLLALCKQSFGAVFAFSVLTNLLSLTPIFYMMNVFNKAVVTNSISTLVALATVAGFFYVILALMEWIRSKVLIHVATRLDKAFAPKLYELCFASESGATNARTGSTPLADLNNLRQFVCSNNAMVFFDLPWLPLFIFLMLMFHPVLALVAVICMALMFCIALLNQRATTSTLRESNKASSQIRSSLQLQLRNAEVAASMGMVTPLKESWRQSQDDMLQMQEIASSASSAYSAVMKTLGMAIQGVAITVGAVLVMTQELAPAAMIGSALLLGKSLAPITQAVGSWRAYVEAWGQYTRLKEAFANVPADKQLMRLPPIEGAIQVSNLVLVPPGGKTPTIKGISFELQQHKTTMIVGHSAAGKSTLVRAILGLWPAAEGEVRIDGAEASHYSRDELGPQIGYLPQDVELFDGSIAENIARFGTISSEDVILAAQDAGIHELILGLPQGYDTNITGAKGVLSPGQRQRVGLARALYKRPKLLVLDEPNSNLDEAGDIALHAAIRNMKQLGRSIVVVSHKHSLLPLSDVLIVMGGGEVVAIGPTAQIVEQMKEQQGIKSVAPTADEVKSHQSRVG